jgi:hypothetical protein
MIRNQQKRSFARSGLHMLEAVDVHDVVSGKMDPTGAERALAPGPKSFPGAAIHAPNEPEGEAFERG